MQEQLEFYHFSLLDILEQSVSETDLGTESMTELGEKQSFLLPCSNSAEGEHL